ncbi:MAG: glycosyltransferase [Bacteroides sp.]|nr:glycosyltransferase [Bacteroides sp.]
MLTIEIQIATLGRDGIERAGRMTLPTLDGLTYTVCAQSPDGLPLRVPDTLLRPDVRVIQHRSAGISLNRNHALDRAAGDIVVVADDDLNYSAPALEALRDYFARHPEVDYVTFRHTGADAKHYPPAEACLDGREPRGYYLTAFELAIRRSSLQPGIRFSTDFGPGAPYFLAGEDIVMLLTLQRAGLHGMFVPLDVCEHPGLTTGHRRATRGVLRAQGGYFRLRYGLAEGLARTLRDIPRRPAPLWQSALYMLQGFFHR